jgi:coenzyme F420-0:L-glutamate ligase / coenzyme F420-1:gamma-L-glutamate ligase
LSVAAERPGSRVELFALPDFPIVHAGDDLAGLIVQCLRAGGQTCREGDVLVVAQKIVSKAENRIIDLASVRPSTRAMELAAIVGKDARLVEVILSESVRVLRAQANVLIVEHKRGFVMANGGVDQSNVAPADGVDRVLLLPSDPDASASALQVRLQTAFDVPIAVVINDSFGRAWRLGTVGVAIGVAGLPALIDKRGATDLFDRPLTATEIAFADEVAAAASLVMGQADEGRPVVRLSGLQWLMQKSKAAELIRPKAQDLFR